MSFSSQITPRPSPAASRNGMASVSCDRSERQKISLYTGPTVHIAIGPEEHDFFVHVKALSLTKFFELCGPPLTAEQKAARAESMSKQPEGGPVSQPEIKEEDCGVKARSRSPTIGLSDVSRTSAFSVADVLGGMSTTPDYYLKGTIYDRNAFELIVNWLYNREPEVPTSRRDYLTLLKSYLIALKFAIDPLQDCIIDRLQKYHQVYSTTFEDFTWLIRRLEDTPKTHATPAVMYLADQIAWEIISLGYGEYAKSNPRFDEYLQKDDHPCRVVLFKALTNIARSSDPSDPANSRNRWKAANRPVVNDTSPLTNMVDTIDIDSD
ncbi:hypothetical protein PV10_04244 [Exophiala mesophila]|uniref:BTB domain-containing protein n=1 Tax=Exophiala mesophila TaxID=212818 RepID=A0A0D1XXP2_EXOME|nr:uncharacterized protein PV10_04244 [Exophiala mesophila]KIV92996.1 hypothetical protein PV10_04244 [Exophiala mesophila]